MDPEKFAKLKADAAASDKKYTPEEVNDFINLGSKFACKPVLHAMMELIKQKTTPENADESAKIIKKLQQKVKYDYTGYITLTFEEIPFKLNVQLTLVDPTYRCEIDVPNMEYATSLYKHYDFLKLNAAAYWRQFAGDNPALMKRLCDFCRDIDISELRMDPNSPTTMCWVRDQPKRVGIFAYYTNSAGKAFYKARNHDN